MATPPFTSDLPLSALERDAGCFGDLAWRCMLPPGEAFAGLEEWLPAQGYAVAGRHRALRLFRRRDHAEIVWLPATGRIQIRVHYTLPRQQRAAVARRTYDDLRRALRRLLAVPP